jgi:F-type H+-transporting ATPase subunit epsilon
MLELIITTVDKQLFRGEVAAVTLPGSEGELTVLAHHEPFITILKKGEMRIRKEKDSEPEFFPVEHGILEVSNNRATVLI